MAVVSIGLPVFEGGLDDDIDTFINLYRGYLNSININPLNAGDGPPSSASRSMGVLRGCMRGPAAEWFDNHITGKNWKIANIRKNGVALMNALRGLNVPEGAGGPNVGTYVPGSATAIDSVDPANAGATIGARYIPNHDLDGNDECWIRSGGQPTSDAVNAPRNAPAGNGNPIVLEGIRPGQALFWLRTNYPTVLEEKRQLNFSTLYQENEPVKRFFEKVNRASRLLKLPAQVRNDQFFKGLSPDNILEAERIGLDLPIERLVDALQRVEQRKAEMHLGLAGRNARESALHKSVTPVQVPQLTHSEKTPQEPLISKPVITLENMQEHLGPILKSYTDNLTKSFQTQMQSLQNTMAQQSQPASRPSPSDPIKRMETRLGTELADYNKRLDEGPWYPSNNAMELAMALTKAQAKAKKARMDRKVDRLAGALGNLNIYDSEEDPMDVDLADGSVILTDADGNEYTAFATRNIKKK